MCMHEFVDEIHQVPGLGQKRNAGLTYSILAVVSFGTYTAIPSFFPCFRSTVEVIFLNAVEDRLQFRYRTQLQNVVPSVSFSISETNPTFVTR
jgi:hypothetical protein